MQVVTGISKRIVLFALLFGMGIIGYSQTPAPEYQIKGAYIFNFAQFTQWPEDAFKSTADPFVIGIVGKDPFGVFIDELVRGEVKVSRQIIVKRFESISEIDAVQILFVSREAKVDEDALLRLMKEKRILTISDMNDFAKRGGIVEFYSEDNKIKFAVNLEEGERRGLQFSSKLLRLANICCK